MEETGGKRTRRSVLKSAAALAGLTTANALFPSLLAQDPINPYASSGEFPGHWPSLSDEEKELQRIPLSDEQALHLMQYKVNHYVLDRDDVVNGLKARKLWPNLKGIPIPVNHVAIPFSHINSAKDALDIFYGNILMQYEKPPFEWDKHPNEARTVGSLWRRFWEHASNHYHEADLENQLTTLHKEFPKGPPYPANAPKAAPLLADYIGSEERAKIDYSGIDFTKLNSEIEFTTFHGARPKNPQAEADFARITRNRPQLDFPHLLNALGISPDLLTIKRPDLEAIGMHVDAELGRLHAEAGVQDGSAPWSARVDNEPGAEPGVKGK